MRGGVAPFAGAWIEIIASAQLSVLSLSLPSRERGLKWQFHAAIFSKVPVAPFAGAWIEITNAIQNKAVTGVAPFAGAWIEI